MTSSRAPRTLRYLAPLALIAAVIVVVTLLGLSGALAGHGRIAGRTTTTPTHLVSLGGAPQNAGAEGTAPRETTTSRRTTTTTLEQTTTTERTTTTETSSPSTTKRLVRRTTTTASLGEVYVVKRGDTPTSIAERFGVPVRRLMSYNHIADPTKVLVGTRLRIPSSG